MEARLGVFREQALFWTSLEIPRPSHKQFWLGKRWLAGGTTVEGVEVQIGDGPRRVYAAKAKWAVARPPENTSSKHGPLGKALLGFPHSAAEQVRTAVLQLSVLKVLGLPQGQLSYGKQFFQSAIS